MPIYPGDELIPRPTYPAVYREVIAAEPEAIWPWLVQVGYVISLGERSVRAGARSAA